MTDIANSPSGRLRSLDVFRGLTIVGMIVVNNPGDWNAIYTPLDHAEWNGWTPTDLIFPFFLFIVGVAITLALPKREQSQGERAARIKIFRRAAIIFGCGLFLAAFLKWDAENMSHLRILGVLQRIALGYLAASLIARHASWQRVVTWIVVLLVGYQLLLLIPAPGSEFYDLTLKGSLPSWFDRTVLGVHTWKPDYDPEGLLSTIPAIATTLIGVLTGHWLARRREAAETTAWMMVVGCLMIVGGELWSIVLPINKALWTSSYVLLTGGIALLTFGCCYWVIDVQKRTGWGRPFEGVGRNALGLYMLSFLLARTMNVVKVQGPAGLEPLKDTVFRTGFSSWSQGRIASLAFALTTLAIWWTVALILDRKKIYIKV